MPARFVEAVEIDERFNGEVVCQGAVKVFELTRHPSGATRAYALELQDRGHAAEVQGRAGRAAGRRVSDGRAREHLGRAAEG